MGDRVQRPDGCPKQQTEATVSYQGRKTAMHPTLYFFAKGIRCPECAVGMCTVFQSQRQQIQMHHHHIPIHNPVQVRQSSAHKFRYAKKYRFHRFLKIKVTLTLRPHPLWVVENSVLLLGPLSSQNRMRIPAFKWPQKTE